MRLLFSHILAGFAVLVGGINAETQSWTSADGKRTIEGEFVRLFGSTVAIKRADGVTVSCQLASLDGSSRDQAKRMANEVKVAATNGGTQTGGLKLSSAKASGIPTDAEIKAFLTEYKETPTSAETYEFNASFAAPKLTPDQIKDYTRKGKVPYRVTITLYKTKMVNDKKQYQRQDGTGCFVVMNEAGDVIDRERKALGKLCPS